VQSYVEQNLNMARQFKDWGDEVSLAPSYTYGTPGQGVAKTVGGLSMLMGQSNVSLKDLVKNWDDGISVPFITGMYDWNMQFNADDTIKGAYNVIAKGATSLVAKELHSNALNAFAASANNPFDAPYLKRANLLRERAKALDLKVDDIVMTNEEIEKAGLPAGGLPPSGAPQPSAPGAPVPPMGGSPIPPSPAEAAATPAQAAGRQ